MKLRIVLIILLCAGCSSNLIFKSYTSFPVENWFSIHSNPEVGDYAVFESDDKEDGWRYEVIGLKDDLIHVRVSWTKRSWWEDAHLKNVFNYYLKPDGRVVRATFDNIETNESAIVRIAGPGDGEYLKDYEASVSKINKIIDTKKGAHNINKILKFSNIVRKPDVVQRHSYVYYLDPEAKFGFVRMVSVINNNFTTNKSETVKLAKKLDSDMGDMDTVATGIANLIGGGDHVVTMQLVESN